MKTVILAAGFGSRLWPISTSENPKQFQPLINNVSLLKYTYEQLKKITPERELFVLILEGMQKSVFKELPHLDAKQMIVVPERRNTLPHTLWALSTITNTQDEPVLFKSVDHFILNEDAFLSSLKQVTQNPDWPAITLLCTAYKEFNDNDGYCLVDASNRITYFLEKPSKEAVEDAVQKGTVYRSPFVFIATKRAMSEVLDELEEEWTPDAKVVLRASGAELKQSFLNLPIIDISTAVFQKSQKMQLAKIEYNYIDVGRFQELYTLNTKDANGNVIVGNVLVAGDCHNNLLINTSPSPMVVISRSESVIVQTEAGNLVSSFEEAHTIGKIYKEQIHRQKH
jgi:mannose-1-phosphate guanylyltransferase